jgi:hypothetical protein
VTHPLRVHVADAVGIAPAIPELSVIPRGASDARAAHPVTGGAMRVAMVHRQPDSARADRRRAMSSDILIIGWDRAVAGREGNAAELFAQAMGFYEAQKKAGNLTGYDSYFMTPHGKGINGMTILRGDRARLDALAAGNEFQAIVMRAYVLLEGFGVFPGVTGDRIAQQMTLFMNSVPRK